MSATERVDGMVRDELLEFRTKRQRDRVSIANQIKRVEAMIAASNSDLAELQASLSEIDEDLSEIERRVRSS